MIHMIQPSELIECVKHWSRYRPASDTPPKVGDYLNLAVFLSPLSAGHPSWDDVRDLHRAVLDLIDVERQGPDVDEYGALFQAQIAAHEAARVVLRRTVVKN